MTQKRLAEDLTFCYFCVKTKVKKSWNLLCYPKLKRRAGFYLTKSIFLNGDLGCHSSSGVRYSKTNFITEPEMRFR